MINSGNDGAAPVAAACQRFLLQDMLNHIAGQGNCQIDTESTLALTDACLRARQSADEKRIVMFQDI